MSPLGVGVQHGLSSQSAHLWSTADFVPRSEALETQDERAYVANPPPLTFSHGQAEITIVALLIITTFDSNCNYNKCANYGAHFVCFSMFVDDHG